MFLTGPTIVIASNSLTLRQGTLTINPMVVAAILEAN